MKKIAITQRIVENDTYVETREALDVRWGQFLERMNAVPIVLPYLYPVERLLKAVQVDGIILTGGNDLAIQKAGRISEIRDKFEQQLLQLALKHKLPVIGVCRGMQLIAHHFGGKLENVRNHVAHRHNLKIKEQDSTFAHLAALEDVNSYHQFGLKQVPEGFTALAAAEDGTVEAMVHNHHKIYGQMWHPERESPFNRAEVAFFNTFFE